MSELPQSAVIPVTNATLQQLLEVGVPLIDVRRPDEWQATGMVPGSRPLTFFDARGECDPAAWLQALAEQVPPGEPLALICRSGQRTGRIAAFLQQTRAYPTIYDVNQGILGWLGENLPVAAAAAAGV